MSSDRNLKLPFKPLELATITDDLSTLLARETAALAAMRLQEAIAFKAEKARLTRIYRAAIEELRAGRANLREATAEERQRLTEAATRLAQVVSENESALRAGRAAIERVVAAIARAVNAKRKSLSAYTPPRRAPARLMPMGGGIAIDHRL